MLSQYYKKDFKILSKLENDMRLVYLDNAATTQKPDVVLAAVKRYYTADNAEGIMIRKYDRIFIRRKSEE